MPLFPTTGKLEQPWQRMPPRRRRRRRASTALERAVELNPGLAAGSAEPRDGSRLARAQIDEAEERLRQMADDFPQDTKPLRELYAIMKELGREEEALEAIEEAVRARSRRSRAAPSASPGSISHVQKPERAEADLPSRLGSRPRPMTWRTLGLAVVFELANRTDELAKLVDEIERRGVARGCRQFRPGNGPPPRANASPRVSRH